MKRQILLLIATMITAPLAAASPQLASSYARPGRADVTATSVRTARSSRSADTTPGRRAQGFSNNPRLNWRHPYLNR